MTEKPKEKPMETQVHETLPVVSSAPVTEIGQLLHLAINEKVPVEILERLAAMKERFEDRSARTEFFAAVAAFQSECPNIEKTSSVKPSSESGMRFGYNYADLTEITDTIRPILERHGLSYSHDTEALPSGMFKVMCTIQHVAGHSRTSTFTCPTSSRAGMSDAQKYAAAEKFGMRHSLILALGLTTADPDTDGADHEPITEAQAHTMDEWFTKFARPDDERARFLKYMGVASLAEIPASKFEAAIRAIKETVASRGIR